MRVGDDVFLGFHRSGKAQAGPPFGEFEFFPGPKRSWVLVVFLKRLSAKNLISRKSVTGHAVTSLILPHRRRDLSV